MLANVYVKFNASDLCKFLWSRIISPLCKCKFSEQMQVHQANSPRKNKSGKLQKSVKKQMQVQHENLNSRKSKSVKKCNSTYQAHSQQASLSRKYKSQKQVQVQEKHKRKKERQLMSFNRRRQDYIYWVGHHKSKYLPPLSRKIRLNRLPVSRLIKYHSGPEGHSIVFFLFCQFLGFRGKFYDHRDRFHGL